MSRVKNLEELVELQAKAIEALQQAAGALRIALEVIQKSHAEKGTQEKIVFVPQPSVPQPNPIPYTPYVGDFPNPWGTATGGNVQGGLQAYAQNAQNVLQNVQSSLANFQSGMMGYETELPL